MARAVWRSSRCRLEACGRRWGWRLCSRWSLLAGIRRSPCWARDDPRTPSAVWSRSFRGHRLVPSSIWSRPACAVWKASAAIASTSFAARPARRAATSSTAFRSLSTSTSHTSRRPWRCVANLDRAHLPRMAARRALLLARRSARQGSTARAGAASRFAIRSALHRRFATCTATANPRPRHRSPPRQPFRPRSSTARRRSRRAPIEHVVLNRVPTMSTRRPGGSSSPRICGAVEVGPGVAVRESVQTRRQTELKGQPP